MRRPSAGNASPRKSSSTPAMIRSSVDLPLPLGPMTPILAPWKNDSQMLRRISRLGGTTLRRSFITKAYSPAIYAAPRPSQPLGGLIVADAELDPHRRRPPGQRQDLRGVAREVLGAPEDLDDVRRLVQIPERRHDGHVEEAPTGDRRIDGPDAVSLPGEIGRHVIGRLAGARLGAHHGDGLGLAQDGSQVGVAGDQLLSPGAHGQDVLTPSPAPQGSDRRAPPRASAAALGPAPALRGRAAPSRRWDGSDGWAAARRGRARSSGRPPRATGGGPRSAGGRRRAPTAGEAGAPRPGPRPPGRAPAPRGAPGSAR